MTDQVTVKMSWWQIGVAGVLAAVVLDQWLHFTIPKPAIVAIGFLGPVFFYRAYLMWKNREQLKQTYEMSKMMMAAVKYGHGQVEEADAVVEQSKPAAVDKATEPLKMFSDRLGDDLKKMADQVPGAPKQDAAQAAMYPPVPLVLFRPAHPSVSASPTAEQSRPVVTSAQSQRCSRSVVGELFCPCDGCKEYREAMKQ